MCILNVLAAVSKLNNGDFLASCCMTGTDMTWNKCRHTALLSPTTILHQFWGRLLVGQGVLDTCQVIHIIWMHIQLSCLDDHNDTWLTHIKCQTVMTLKLLLITPDIVWILSSLIKLWVTSDLAPLFRRHHWLWICGAAYKYHNWLIDWMCEWLL
jgi:hypothetical protein